MCYLDTRADPSSSLKPWNAVQMEWACLADSAFPSWDPVLHLLGPQKRVR